MLQYVYTWLLALKGEEGQDLAEYALLIALIAVALVVVLGLLSGSITEIFQSVRGVLDNAANP